VAVRYLFIAAILAGELPVLTDLLPSKHDYDGNNDILVFVGRGIDVVSPLAAAQRQPDGKWAFSFVDADGMSVGNILYLKAK
jgi:hypothetical protein